MILESLAEYYDVLCKTGKLDKPGWSRANVSWALSIDDDGRLLDIIDLRKKIMTGKKETAIPQEMSVPTPPEKTSKLCASFLCSDCKYFLGIDEKTDKKKTADPEAQRRKNRARAVEAFHTAAALHESLLADVNTPEAHAVCEYFRSWNPEHAMDDEHVLPLAKVLSDGGKIVFFYKDHYVLGNVREVSDAWDAYYARSDNPVCMQCLDTGETDEIAILHPAIKGVSGAQPTGAKIVSFNVESLESYGRQHGELAPTSRQTTFAYGEALNYLLRDRNRVSVIGKTTVVSWAPDGETAYEDVFDAMLSGMSETISESDLASIISKLAQGKAVNWKNIPLHPENRFCILGLAPNKGRLSVKFFYQDTFGDVAEKMNRHYERLAVTNMQTPYPSAYALLFETVNRKSEDKTPSPQMAGEMIRAILTDDRYPDALYYGVMNRISADRITNSRRASIIKAYLLKNTNCAKYKEALTVELNENCTYAPYLLGRLFAILEEIQDASALAENKKLNRTIKDSWFASASSMPAYAYPALINLAQAHLKKVDSKNEKYAVYLSKKLTALLGMIHEEYPAMLSLHDQGVFQLGYYHQREERFRKKAEKASDDAAENAAADA